MKNLKELRKITGLTQEAFAKLIGVTYGSMRQIESKDLSLSPDRLLKISNEIGCGLDYGPGYPGQVGRTMAFTSNAPKPIGIKLTQKGNFEDGNFIIPMRDEDEIPFTREYFEHYRALKAPWEKIRGLRSTLEGLLMLAFDESVHLCSRHLTPDEIKDTLYPIFEGIVDGVLKAASSSFGGTKSLVEHIRHEQGWGVDLDKYNQDPDPKEVLRSWLMDMVSDVDFKMLSTLRDAPGGTSPQN